MKLKQSILIMTGSNATGFGVGIAAGVLGAVSLCKNVCNIEYHCSLSCFYYICMCSWFTLVLLQVLVVGGVVLMVRRKKSAATGEQLNNSFFELASTYHENRS